MFFLTFICLSVCLCARLLKNTCMDLDEMLRVDRCRDMDNLINSFEPDPDHSPDAKTGLLSPIAYALQRVGKICIGLLSRMHCSVEFYYIGKIPRTGIGCCRSSDTLF